MQTVQTICFMLTMIPYCPAPLSGLRGLRFSNGYNYFAGMDYARVYTYPFSLSQMGIEK